MTEILLIILAVSLIMAALRITLRSILLLINSWFQNTIYTYLKDKEPEDPCPPPNLLDND